MLSSLYNSRLTWPNMGNVFKQIWHCGNFRSMMSPASPHLFLSVAVGWGIPWMDPIGPTAGMLIISLT